jgi:hypothetical protein
MKEFYLCSEKTIHNIINEMFVNFEIHIISPEVIKKNNFTNQNFILIVTEDLLKTFNDSFFSNNNIVILNMNNKNFNNNILFDVKVFNKHINISKFIDEVTISFEKNIINFGDIKILGEKIINTKTEKEILLTSLEKNIFILLIDQKKTERKILLESVLKIKKDTETKTIESHLSRIRNKLLKINSKIKILSKADKIHLFP